MTTANNIILGIREKFPTVLLKFEELSQSNRIQLSVEREKIQALTEYVFNTLRARLIMSVGTDKTPIDGSYTVIYIYSLDTQNLLIHVKEIVPQDDPSVPSVTGIVPGADWHEREVYDLLGIKAIGHPDPRRLILSDDWPEDVFPLRKEVPYNFHPPVVREVKAPLREPNDKEKKATILSVGPFFPTLEEPAYFRLFVEGEQIVGSDYRGFFAHRGMEKMADSVLDYNQVAVMSERICGICGFVQSACYCMAVEQAAEIQVPPRASYIRNIMMELERVHSHLLWIGLAGHYLGFDTVLMQSWRIREPVMWLVEKITGNRKTYGLNLPGGVRRDLTPELCDDILSTIDVMEKQVRELVDAALSDKTMKMRLQNVGIFTPEDARGMCAVGPTARGSGIDIDARKDRPYGAYPALTFKSALQHGCDVLSRTQIRMEEVFTAFDLIRQMVAKLPQGELMAHVGNIPPWREGVGIAEAPRGECVHYIETGPNNRPYRWRVRAATYPQLESIPKMLAGMQVADFPIIVGSIDPCFSCTERVIAVDRDTKKLRIYKKEDLLAMSKQRTKSLR